jgi:hypothetical protein
VPNADCDRAGGADVNAPKEFRPGGGGKENPLFDGGGNENELFVAVDGWLLILRFDMELPIDAIVWLAVDAQGFGAIAAGVFQVIEGWLGCTLYEDIV